MAGLPPQGRQVRGPAALGALDQEGPDDDGASAAHLADYATSAGIDLQYIAHPGTFIGPKRTFEDWGEGRPPGYAAQLPPNADDGPAL